MKKKHNTKQTQHYVHYHIRLNTEIIYYYVTLKFQVTFKKKGILLLNW